jgi:hypothetical protein
MNTLNTTFFILLNEEVIMQETKAGDLKPWTLIEWFKNSKIKGSSLQSWTEGDSENRILGVNGLLFINL